MVKFSRYFLALASVTALSAGLLFAGDPAGDWKASVDVNGNDVPLTFHLKVKDASVTGAIEGMPTTPADIQNGKLEGDNITFTAVTDYEGNSVKLIYKGKIDGDQIKFSVGTDDGSWGVEFVAKRSS
jgi:hypothetical protein